MQDQKLMQDLSYGLMNQMIFSLLRQLSMQQMSLMLHCWNWMFSLLMFQSLFHLYDTPLNTLLTFLAMFFKTPSKRLHFFCSFPKPPTSTASKAMWYNFMKEVKSFSGKVVLYPKLMYCYKGIVETLQETLNQPDFSIKCEAWSNRSHQDRVYKDVYDGQLWKEFQIPDGIPFLSLPNNFAFHINVDWFNPFTHTQHSEGAIYMTVLNLLQHDQFLQHKYTA